MRTILDQIVETKRGEVDRAKALCPIDEMIRAASTAPPPRDFFAALAAPPPAGVHLIAEIKRSSPSAGLIRADLDPPTIAQIYEQAGASAISVLTDETHFGGHLKYIGQVKSAVALPVLRKDFLFEEYQIYEARRYGADAVLLIAEVLSPDRIKALSTLACDLAMATLVEVHSEALLTPLLEQVDFTARSRRILGINNRDLTIQQTDIAATGRLASMAPPDAIMVSESGIATRAEVLRVVADDAHAILVGESLLRADDIGAKVRALLGVSGE